MKNKKKEYSSIKLACKISRKNEIAMYGKIISLKPSVTHKSKKDFNRKETKKIDVELI